MKIKLSFITNSSSVNYTLSDTNINRETLEVIIEGITFDLFKEFKDEPPNIFKTLEDLDNEEVGAREEYKSIINSGKIIYEFWTDGEGSLIKSYLYHNKISNDRLPPGVENVDIYLGG